MKLKELIDMTEIMGGKERFTLYLDLKGSGPLTDAQVDCIVLSSGAMYLTGSTSPRAKKEEISAFSITKENESA